MIGLVLALLVGGNDGRVNIFILLMGAAAANDRAWTMRYRAIEDAHVQRATDIRFDRQPGTTVALKVLELNTDPEHWTNRSLVRYRRRTKIRVSTIARDAVIKAEHGISHNPRSCDCCRSHDRYVRFISLTDLDQPHSPQ